MTSTTEQRWQGERSERLGWTSLAVGLIGLLLLSLVLLVESLDASHGASGARSQWVSEQHLDTEAHCATIEAAILEDMGRGVKTE